MKKLLKILLALAACSAALCVTAAAGADELAPAKVWGKVSPWEGEGLLLKNDDQNDAFQEVVVHPGDAPVVDAATGLPLSLEAVKEGETLYAWIGPAATMSLPPQVFARIIVGNVPADAAAPDYCEIAGAAVPGENGETSFPVLGGGTLIVTGKTAYSPWLTRQIVRVEDLVPGARALVWKDEGGRAEKVLLFAYAYRGYASWDETGRFSINGEALSVSGRVNKNEETGEELLYLPLRAVAEAAGYSVSWDKNRGAVVQDENVDLVFFAVPGEDVIFQNGRESGISGPCILENGVTYLPAEDLCRWLNLFLASE